jgi:hypothetical protein
MKFIKLLIFSLLTITTCASQAQSSQLTTGQLGIICKCYIGKRAKHRFYQIAKRGATCDQCESICRDEQPAWNKFVEPWNGDSSCTSITDEQQFKINRYGTESR